MSRPRGCICPPDTMLFACPVHGAHMRAALRASTRETVSDAEAFVETVLLGGASPLATHPDLCPTCRAPISREQRERIDAAQRCTCPVGFGAVADPSCQRHGAAARHTITGPAAVLGA